MDVPTDLFLEGKIDFLMALMVKVEAAREVDQKRLAHLEEANIGLHKIVPQLLNQLSDRDQQARGKSLRLFGVSAVPEEASPGPEASGALAKKVYEIIKHQANFDCCKGKGGH
jgi:hypothetical protein